MEFKELDLENLDNFKYNKNIQWSKWNSKVNSFKKNEHVKSELIYGSHFEERSNFSIVIPTFRRKDLLTQSIESAINQINYNEKYEIIIIDNDNEIDLETDSLMKNFCEKYNNIIYYRNTENIGMFANWNRCIEVCRSKWFCMLHDDDFITEDYLSTMESFNLSDDIGIVFNEQNILDETGIKASSSRNVIARIREFINHKKENQKTKLIAWKFPQTASSCATFYNKELCLEIGGFDDSFDPACDWIMWGKMEYYHKVFRTGKRLSYYRFLCNGFLRPEIQRYVMIYGFVFAKKYFESKKYSTQRAVKAASKYEIIVYKNMTTSNPERKDLYYKTLKELNLEKKYYKTRTQSKIYLGYLIKQGLEKIFRL